MSLSPMQMIVQPLHQLPTKLQLRKLYHFSVKVIAKLIASLGIMPIGRGVHASAPPLQDRNL